MTGSPRVETLVVVEESRQVIDGHSQFNVTGHEDDGEV